ncbi:MobV family relaxase [Pseudomonas sp.]|uniref:MobV family relaxase n=1 Tax=Pseudomonas sp. TaxID=306 RepID=UPI0027314CC1|nr:MobV family relaxase [Pseudomonas sp.]MDP2245233.1 MobV family relaxase [Pseudomonas sp.]
MFAIIRTKKHKTISSVARSAGHTFREQATPNANSAITHKNPVSGAGSTQSLLTCLSDRLPEARRRDAVVCIEYLITASPEAFKRHGGHLEDAGSGYFHDAMRWLRERHGNENILCAVVHLDETTPHLVAYVVPITRDGRLSARDFLGGPKLMRAMQDSFHFSCGKNRGLLRGIQGSKAHHGEVSHFYAALHGHEQQEQKLTRSDYVAKAFGYETEQWKQAQATAHTQSQGVAVHSVERKATQARAQALERAERQSEITAKRLKQLGVELDKRELSLTLREEEISRRKPDLDIALARVEAMERIIVEQNNIRKHTLLLSHTIKPRYSPQPRH